MARLNLGYSSHACDAEVESTSLKQIYLAQSYGFIAITSVFFSSALLAIILSAWSYWLIGSLLLLLAFDYQRVVRLYGTRNSQYAVSWLLYDCGKWQYGLFNGRAYTGKFVPKRSLVSTWLIILYIQSGLRGRYIVVPRDALSQHKFRLLAYQIQNLSRSKLY